MTVKDIYDITKQIMFEKPSSTIYDNYLIANLNRLLAELFHENNMCRMFFGKPRLEEIPQISSRDDEIPFEPEYALNVLPLGLAARFAIDDDLNKYSIYNTDYQNARVMAQKLVGQEKMDAS